MTLSLVHRTRLEKVARDNGFDLEPTEQGGWLAFRSSHSPLVLWLSVFGDAVFVAAFSLERVARALGELGTPMLSPLPPGAAAGRTAGSIPELHALVRRAFQLARSLPDEPLQAFQKQTRALPRSTEAERLVVQRVGQEIFRESLLDYWEGRCAITGLAERPLLRASHIKPWASCESDAERLDVFNGLLLAPHLDALLDQGYLTVDDDGTVLVTSHLSAESRQALGLTHPLRVARLTDAHRAYLAWHRTREFERWVR
ncbi:MAG: HNH endonuclease [Myxococcales bacterium]|nr:HNH endonuclease [Polyangiaceae bacterium]MDW8249988.1 HNH endonuclease [Myxococcales bacterium]